jgi:general secretion pathway protein G
MLAKRITEARRNDQGFTLIEMLIVIIVLGILASIVVFGVSTFKQDAALAACKSDLKVVQTASDAYYAKNGSYATAIGATGSAVATELTGANLLKNAPAAASGLSYNATNGTVTSSVASCTL